MYTPKTTECKCNNCGILFQKTIKSLKQRLKKGEEVYCTKNCFNLFIKRKTVVVNCNYCKNNFEIIIGKYNTSKKLGLKAFYCNRECHANSLKKIINFPCSACGILTEKRPWELNENNKYYCSDKCFRSELKSTRSKLEIYLENKVKEYFPYINVMYSDRKQCRNLELDFYFPDLKLAIEINGIFHYEPKFGIDSLKRAQHNDKGKKYICYQKGIELHVIKSIENYAQKGIKERDWKIFKNILMSKIPFCETEDDCISNLYDKVNI